VCEVRGINRILETEYEYFNPTVELMRGALTVA
jgi:hypothetical protein